LSGGTGSGFFSLLVERLSVDYPKISKNAFLLYPSHNMSNNTVDMYNAVLSTSATLEHCDSVVMFDNESMYNVLKENIDLEYVDYSHLNNLVA
jgi:tubulin alpha